MNLSFKGVETSELTVNSNFFTETDATMFKIQVDIVQTSQSDNVSTNYTTFELFQLNQPPYNGTCSIEPTIGVALSTIFVITCQDWIDNSGSVSKYEYFGKLIEYRINEHESSNFGFYSNVVEFGI